MGTFVSCGNDFATINTCGSRQVDAFVLTNLEVSLLLWRSPEQTGANSKPWTLRNLDALVRKWQMLPRTTIDVFATGKSHCMDEVIESLCWRTRIVACVVSGSDQEVQNAKVLAGTFQIKSGKNENDWFLFHVRQEISREMAQFCSGFRFAMSLGRKKSDWCSDWCASFISWSREPLSISLKPRSRSVPKSIVFLGSHPKTSSSLYTWWISSCVRVCSCWFRGRQWKICRDYLLNVSCPSCQESQKPIQVLPALLKKIIRQKNSK